MGDTWDIDIYKPMILAVEQDNWASHRHELELARGNYSARQAS